MRILTATLLVALLSIYSQIIVKWRTASPLKLEIGSHPIFRKLMKCLADPYILYGYMAALLGSFVWVYLVAKLPLATAFPIYIGLTFSLVLFGGWFFLAETMSATKVIAVLMILGGIALGMQADA